MVSVTGLRVAIGIGLTLGLPASYLLYLRRKLSRDIQHDFRRVIHAPERPSTEYFLGDLPAASPEDLPCMSAVVEEARVTVSKPPLLTLDEGELLVHYLRSHFTRMSYIRRIWAWCTLNTLLNEHTFGKSYIHSLQFNQGDRVCGTFTVTSRTSRHVTLSVDMPLEVPLKNRQLCITIDRIDNHVRVSNQTFEWKRTQLKQALGAPVFEDVGLGRLNLTHPLVRWLHELETWRLLDSGARDLSR